jgi:hypothetical protein
MSSRYTADGRRISSMTHARRSHTCELCGHVGFGNGAETAHGRAHVRRGEAVEMVREYAMVGIAPSRVFVAPTDTARVEDLRGRGFAEATP